MNIDDSELRRRIQVLQGCLLDEKMGIKYHDDNRKRQLQSLLDVLQLLPLYDEFLKIEQLKKAASQVLNGYNQGRPIDSFPVNALNNSIKQIIVWLEKIRDSPAALEIRELKYKDPEFECFYKNVYVGAFDKDKCESKEILMDYLKGSSEESGGGGEGIDPEAFAKLVKLLLEELAVISTVKKDVEEEKKLLKEIAEAAEEEGE